MDVTMPQLGETVTAGTITRWFKQVGDQVAADEPLFEVSTDKVDSEVPAPAAGILSEILVGEGETVDVGARLAVIGAGVGAPAPAPAPASTPAAAAPAAPAPQEIAPAPVDATPVVVAAPAVVAPAAAAPFAPAPTAHATAVAPAPPVVPSDLVASPLVRRMIADYGLDPAGIPATGDGGRITRNDVLAAAQVRGAGAPAALSAPGAPAPAAPAPQPTTDGVATTAVPADAVDAAVPQLGDTVIPFDTIRKRTAEHMVRSKATSAHVYTSIEVDFEAVERIRRTLGPEFRAAEGFSLTYLPFICRALADVVHDFPHVNATVDGESLVVHRDLHLAIAVDLDFHGLLAPVVRNADGKRMRLLAREIRDLATRAKSRKLRPDDLSGGTFTITNMGPMGTTMTLPIINQPQIAILAADGVQKRPVVVEGPDGEDVIAIHHVGMLTLAWDHRAFDGAYAGLFLHAMKQRLEHHDWEPELT